MRPRFVRALLVTCGAFLAFFLAEFLLEWARLGQPGIPKLGWQGVNNAKLVDLMSPIARAYNNVLAMLLATIGLAIPLTANMHAPKLIDMFLRDRLNQTMLSLMAFGAANVIYVDYIIGPDFAPMWAIRFAIYFALLGWAALIPYFFYVIRFLDPSNIITRLREETIRTFDRVKSGEIDTESGQDLVHERVHQIGTIILKSLDRADRGVALEGVWALKLLIGEHGERKKGMPDGWFLVDRKDFVGLSGEALEMLNEERTWFEMKALTQLFFAYQQALTKTADVVSSISDAVRVIAEMEAKRGDQASLRLAIRFFNNFVREALKRKDVHSMYDVFYEYRLLSRGLSEHPDEQRAIARYMRYYAHSASVGGAPFVEHLAAFELGYMTRRAYEVKSTAARDLLTDALAIPHGSKDAFAQLVVEAKLMLGGFFGQHGLEEEAAVVRKNLGDVPPSLVREAEQKLLGAERCFFEVTDRQENIEYVRPERREPLQKFVAELAPSAPAAAAS
jgi:hypothetical protein